MSEHRRKRGKKKINKLPEREAPEKTPTAEVSPWQEPPGALLQRARLEPDSLRPVDAARLQRTIGNRALGHLVSQGKQRPKTPGEEDKLEERGKNGLQRTLAPTEMVRQRPKTPGEEDKLQEKSKKSEVLRYLQRLGEGAEAEERALYRQEIAEFQRQNSPEKITAHQQRILELHRSVDIRQRDRSQTLRRKGNGDAKSEIPEGPDYEAGKQITPNFILNKPASKRSNSDASTTSAKDPTFTGHVAVDKKSNQWKYQLDSVEAKGTIQIVYYTKDYYPAPTPNDDSGPLTNVTEDNWGDIVNDLDANKAGIADEWSAYRAEDVHENYHWKNEWQVEAKKGLVGAEAAIARLGVGFDKASSAGEAESKLKPKATELFNSAMAGAREQWNKMGDSAGDPPYQVQVPVVEALIKRVKDHAKDKGWE